MEVEGVRYRLRPAVPADLEPMMAIGHEGLRPYVEALRGWDPAYEAQAFRAHFTPETISIIQVAGRDVGYLKLEVREGHLYLDGIYLDEAHRRRGIGTAVLRDLMARAGTLGKPVRLRVLRPNPARALYERLGFHTTAETSSLIDMEFDPRPRHAP